MIGEIGEDNILLLAEEMKAKKFSFSAAKGKMKKKKCFDYYLQGKTYGQAAASASVSKDTVFGWFKGFKDSHPL